MTKRAKDDGFKTRKKALDWLSENGFKISQGKFYKDCCPDGVVPLKKNGSVDKADVVRYANTLNVTTPQTKELSKTRENKEELERKILEVKLAKNSLDLDREREKWLSSEKAFALSAGLAGAIKDAVSYHIRHEVLDVIEAAGGKKSMETDCIEAMDAVFVLAYNEVANKETIRLIYYDDVED